MNARYRSGFLVFTSIIFLIQFSYAQNQTYRPTPSLGFQMGIPPNPDFSGRTYDPKMALESALSELPVERRATFLSLLKTYPSLSRSSKRMLHEWSRAFNALNPSQRGQWIQLARDMSPQVQRNLAKSSSQNCGTKATTCMIGNELRCMARDQYAKGCCSREQPKGAGCSPLESLGLLLKLPKAVK